MTEEKKRPIGEIVNEFAELRDFLSAERKKFKELETKLKDDLERLEAQILDAQREIGVTSLSTDGYTAFQTIKKSVRVGNWHEFISYVEASKNFQLLEKRCAKLACLEVFDDGVVPAEIGLDLSIETVVQVRKR